MKPASLQVLQLKVHSYWITHANHDARQHANYDAMVQLGRRLQSLQPWIPGDTILTRHPRAGGSRSTGSSTSRGSVGLSAATWASHSQAHDPNAPANAKRAGHIPKSDRLLSLIAQRQDADFGLGLVSPCHLAFVYKGLSGRCRLARGCEIQPGLHCAV